MGKKKKTETQQNQQFQNTYGQITPNNTPDIDAVRDWKPGVDPSVGYSFARQRQNLKDRFDSPMGAYAPPAVQDAIMRAEEGRLAQTEGATYQQGAYDDNNRDLVRKTSLAEMTAPRIVQTGGASSGNSTQTYKPGWGEQVSQGIGSLGGLLMM